VSRHSAHAERPLTVSRKTTLSLSGVMTAGLWALTSPVLSGNLFKEGIIEMG